MNNTINKIPLIGYALYTLITYSIVMTHEVMTSFLLSLTYIWSAYLLIKIIQRNILSRNILGIFFFMMFLSFVNVTINGIIDNAALDFGYYKKVIMFNSTIVWMLYCMTEKISRKSIIIILLLNIFLTFIYATNFQSGYELDMESGNTYLYMHFSNSNLAGFFLSECAIYLLLTIFLPKNMGMRFIYRIALIPALLFILYLTYLTGCRSAFLGLLFMGGCVIFDIYKSNCKKLPRFLLGFWALLPIIFLFVYISFISSINLDFSFGLESEKSNYTRLESWDFFLDYVFQYPIIGGYSSASNGTGAFQALNTHLDVLVSYGILPFFLFVYLLYKSVSDVKLGKAPLFNRMCFYAYLSILLPSCFEAGLVSGSVGLFIACYGYLLLANSYSTEIENSKI